MAFVLFAAGGRSCCDDLYARRVAATLGAATVAIAGSAPIADGEGSLSARAAWETLAPDARPLIAGAVLSHFAPMAALMSARNAAILIDEPIASVRGLSDAERRFLTAIEQQALALAPLILASSEAAADAIAVEAAVSRERISVVEPPTPEFPRAAGSGRGEAVIFSPGAAGDDDARAVLFRALAGLGDLEWRLCVAGAAVDDPGSGAAIAALAARFGLGSRVQCERGASSGGDEALWRQSDLFATARASPGYGLATAAALKRGLPVVIAREAKSAPAIPPDAGAIALPGDHVQLGKALRRLIFDRDLRAAMAEAAWQAGKLLPTNGEVRERLLVALR